MSKFNHIIAGAATTAALAGGGYETQVLEPAKLPQAVLVKSDEGVAASPISEYERNFAAYCIEAAVSVGKGELNNIDPAKQVGSSYPSKNLRKFSMTILANEVPANCREIVTGRTIKAEQIYRGRVNTRKPVIVGGLDAINETRQMTLKESFKCIKGPKSRAYQERARIRVTTNGHGTFEKTTTDTVRGKHDGC